MKIRNIIAIIICLVMVVFTNLLWWIERKKVGTSATYTISGNLLVLLEDLRIRTGRKSIRQVLIDAFTTYDWVVREYEDGNPVLARASLRGVKKTDTHLRLVYSKTESPLSPLEGDG